MLMSSRPYLIQAVFDWIIDNGLTPFLMIDTTVEGVCAPRHIIVDNEIVFNLSPEAISHFVMNKGYIQFKGRFAGRIEEIYAPMQAIKAMYAKENMSGIGFTPEGAPYFAGDVTGEPHRVESKTQNQDAPKASLSQSRTSPPHLKLVVDD
jgi:stringent starvation protein B